MKDEILEYKRVFLENASDPQVSWRMAYMNFCDYCEMARAEPMDTDEDRMKLAADIRKCSELLVSKAIDPKNIAMSFVLWKDNLGG